MLNFSDIILLMGLGFSLAAPLGPVNMEMIKKSLQSKFGFILGVFTGLGAMTGDFLIATIVLFIGDEYLRNLIEITWVYLILLIFNIFILGYIGISALRSSSPSESEIILGQNSEEKEEEIIKSNIGGFNLSSIFKQLATGFAIVVTSPWSYFWWTSFGGYIINSGLPLGNSQERLVVTAFFLSGILTWVLIFCILLGISQQMASPKTLNLITKSSAVIIIGFAIKIMYDGIRFITNFTILNSILIVGVTVVLIGSVIYYKDVFKNKDSDL